MNTPLGSPDHRIIYEPDKQTSGQRRLFGALTGIAWFVYAYLWLPVITALAWYFGVKTTYVELYLRDNRIDSFLILAIPLIIVIVCAILLGWAEYNRIRFQRKEDRRESAAEVSNAEVAFELGATESLGAQLQETRLCTINMSERANPLQLVLPATATQATTPATTNS